MTRYARRTLQIPKVPDTLGQSQEEKLFFEAIKNQLDARQGLYSEQDQAPTMEELKSKDVIVKSIRTVDPIVYDEMTYPAGLLRSTGSASWDGTRIGWSFADGVTSGAHGTNKLPPAYNEDSPINIHIHWMPTTGGSGNIRLDFQYRFYDAVEVMPSWTTGTTLTIAAPSTADQMMVTTIINVSGTNLKRNSFVDIEVERDGADVLDTYTGAMVLKEIDVMHQRLSELPRGLGQRSVYYQ